VKLIAKTFTAKYFKPLMGILFLLLLFTVLTPVAVYCETKTGSGAVV